MLIISKFEFPYYAYHVSLMEYLICISVAVKNCEQCDFGVCNSQGFSFYVSLMEVYNWAVGPAHLSNTLWLEAAQTSLFAQT